MSRQRPTRRSVVPSLMLTRLEDRSVPAGFNAGTIQGQDGWAGGTTVISPQVTQFVDQTGTLARTGTGAYVVSNSTAAGDYNGLFAGWPFGPALSVAAGQPSSGTTANMFTATLWFRTVSGSADGSNIEIDLGTVSGADRNSYLSIQNKADVDGGLQIETTEPDGNSGNFFAPTTQVTNLTRGVWHRLDLVATFRDGSVNDNIRITLDGTLIPNIDTGGQTFDTFEGYFEGTGQSYQQTSRLFFRSGLKPSEVGSFSDTGAQGFALDDISYSSANSSAPSVPLATYFSAFETQPTLVYSNRAWAALANGTPIADANPNMPGNQPATVGTDAFGNLSAAAAAVAPGGQVWSFGAATPGTTTIAAGTTLNPGGVGGTASVTNTGDVAFATGAIFSVDLNGSAVGTGYDRLTVNGTANIGGARLVINNGYSPAAADSFTVLQATTLTGQFANLPAGSVMSINGLQYKVKYTNNSVLLELDRADLSVTVTDVKTSVQAGGQNTYTVVVRNTGPNSVTGAAFTLFPPGTFTNVTFGSVASGGATGNTNGAGAISDSLTLPVGSFVTYTIVGTVSPAAGPTLALTATVAPPATSVVDTNAVNNTATDTDTVIPPDTTRPTAVISSSGPLTAGVQKGMIITFSESVQGFTQDEVNLVNATLFGFLSLGDGRSYAITIIPTGPGAVGVSIPDLAAVDASGNPSIAAASSFTAASPVIPTPPVQPRYATAVGGVVTVHNPTNGTTTDITPYPAFGGVVTVATGDLNGDGIPELVTGAGAGGGPHVKVFDGATNNEIGSFFAYDANFTGGVFVAVGGGRIVTGAGAGGGPHVKVFDAVGNVLASFFAYDASFTGGVRVAAADENGDGMADIVTGAGAGGGPHVRVFDGRTFAETQSFFAFDTSFSGGVYVGATNGQIVVGAGNGVTTVKTFDGRTGAELGTFTAYDPGFTGGVRVAVADVNGDSLPDLITGAGPGGGPHVKAFTMSGFTEEASFFAASLISPDSSRGVFVG